MDPDGNRWQKKTNRQQTNLRAVGRNQSLKMIKSGKCRMTYIAKDADVFLIDELTRLCTKMQVQTDMSCTKEQLGKLCGLDVGCAVLALAQ